MRQGDERIVGVVLVVGRVAPRQHALDHVVAVCVLAEEVEELRIKCDTEGFLHPLALLVHALDRHDTTRLLC